MWTERSVPFPNQNLSSRLVFSFVPRCQGECGSQKNSFVSNAIWMRSYSASSVPRSQVIDRRKCSGSVDATGS